MVKRELYLEKIYNFMDKNVIKIITGMRRCGKSYLFKLIIEELKKKGINERKACVKNCPNAVNTWQKRTITTITVEEVIITIITDIVVAVVITINNINKYCNLKYTN